MKSKEFIEINNSIQDYQKYKSDIHLLTQIILTDSKDFLKTLGFDIAFANRSTYSNLTLVMDRKDIDLECEINIRKRSPEVFA